jgi:NhaP-type Na+/H+ or K+/H+ antiporter
VLSAIRQRRGGERVSWQVPAVVSWAGARGVVPLAAALSLPVATLDGSALPARDLVLLLTTAVIVLTLVVQGFTLAPLVRRAGIALDPADLRTEYATARRKLAEAGLGHLDHLAETESAAAFAVDQLRAHWQARLDHVRGDGDGETGDPARAVGYRALRRELLDIEAAELTRLFEAGEITDGTRRRIQRLLDLEHAGLED